MTLRIALVAVALATLAACDSAETYGIGGVYSGTANDADFLATITFDVPDVETGETFSFTGSTTQFGETDPYAGTGTYDYPDITFTVGGDAVDGTVSEDGETIRLEFEDGDDAEPVTLVRQ